jgi:hypothetical protein
MANPNFFKVAMAVMGATISLGVQTLPGWANDYWFTVINRSSTPVREVWVSEDGEDWQYFDLNGSSIPSNGSMQLVWDESTYDSGCVWWIQAVYSTGEESEAAQFDFCENPELILTD